MKPLSKANQEICRQLILANELIVHSEEVKGEELKETLIEARSHAKSAYHMIQDLFTTTLSIGDSQYTVTPMLKIRAILAKYPNRRVHEAISELLGDDVYNAIKEG